MTGDVTGDGASAGVRAEVVGACGRVVLDRTRALNALDLPMVLALRDALDRFADDPAVRVVTLGSAHPTVFCAGGDVREIRRLRLAGEHEAADAFFENEFALNARIAAFPKPFVALVDGLCLGGGMGLSVHGSHRLVGPRAEMAMPETAIGYFPDVGGSWFLNRLPGAFGRYMGLTGARVSSADAVWAGLATAAVTEDGLRLVEEQLAEDASPEEAIAAASPLPPPAIPGTDRAMIDRCFTAESVEAIEDALGREGTPFAHGALAALGRASPASLRITLALLDRMRTSTLAECLAAELVLAREVTRGPEFSEGIRAMLVDKDREPRWPSATNSRAAAM